MYQVYRVIDDDTLDSLCSRFSISSDELVRINGFDSFDVGDLIVVPDRSFYFSYFVKSGDTMYDIARRYDQDVNMLYRINGIKEGDFIYPNQEVLIPKRGVFLYMTGDDSLSDVSNSIGVSISDIIDSNPNLLLMPDQVIVYKRG